MEASLPYLSEDVLVQILARLPAKPLLRLRTVCKSWKTIVGSPEFRSLHLSTNSHSSKVLLTTKYPQVLDYPDTIAECGPSLLPLASCGPFVQGNAAHPAQSCCHGLDQIHSQRPGCLCLLLHDSDLLFAFPINTTLALQLPAICHLGFDVSTCRGAISSPSLAPPARDSSGPKPNSSVVFFSNMDNDSKAEFQRHRLTSKCRSKAESKTSRVDADADADGSCHLYNNASSSCSNIEKMTNLGLDGSFGSRPTGKVPALLNNNVTTRVKSYNSIPV
ncbi:Bifunctional inhibitor/lipid-transfer protein/seed storage 2S albumin superfamily protein [Striga hermonthica]|uniref:Bifunctional inhibitor/lipid-transfer protein/seed storage 2S albumin superfamily protein n=1 Tax=Striga hermonthica TaxID=68872 RepID=A0A9N7MZ05_STRHE|nr:Bifunctional inhibitor/lipid-transfer protein/seed storage 2S albumin superfamily protein [Striga hermonthica]